MRRSESIKNIAKALAQFQAEVRNPANTETNPYFKSKYAPLNNILNLVRPLLSKHGLSILQSPSGDGQNVTVTTLITHESGEWIESEPLTLKAEKATAQGAGSAITYARRYALSAMLGISSEDDDDGNFASGNKDENKSTANDTEKNKTDKPTTHDDDKPERNNKKFASFWGNVKKLGFTEEEVHEIAGVDSLKGFSQAQLNSLLLKLRDMKQEQQENKKKMNKKEPNVSSESMADHFAYVGYMEMCDTW